MCSWCGSHFLFTWLVMSRWIKFAHSTWDTVTRSRAIVMSNDHQFPLNHINAIKEFQICEDIITCRLQFYSEAITLFYFPTVQWAKPPAPRLIWPNSQLRAKLAVLGWCLSKCDCVNNNRRSFSVRPPTHALSQFASAVFYWMSPLTYSLTAFAVSLGLPRSQLSDTAQLTDTTDNNS